MSSPVKFKVYGNIVIAETVEYMNISKREVDALNDVVKNKISGNFGLIDIRLRNTSIDPLVYLYIKELMPKFTAFALVTKSELTHQLFKCESVFMKDMRFKTFYSLAEADIWMQEVLGNEINFKGKEELRELTD